MLNLSSLKNNKKLLMIKSNHGKETSSENFWSEKGHQDASEHSISGILSQEGHPIMYLSKSLTITEFNYSNIEKETFDYCVDNH